jgi:hypothetical protein
MNPRYVVPRLIRHFLPERIVRFMLLRSMIIKPGLETVDPDGAISRYLQVLSSRQISIRGKRALVFGYGGRFDIGVGLLAAGADFVALTERYAPPDEPHNLAVMRHNPAYVIQVGGVARPHPDHMQLVTGDIRALPPPTGSQLFDLVVSNSVYEHLEDADGITKALLGWTAPAGVHVHFVDLRDHYFKYPFEMLTFSERTWRRLLDPTSHHNRLRLWNYRQIFEACFESVEIEVLALDKVAFAEARHRIRPEFVSGDPAQDAATLVRIVARGPRVSNEYAAAA